MEGWMIWIACGVVCMIVEIFTPGFFFMSFGVGAILTGLFSILIPNLAAQILFFAVVTLLVFINLRKFSSKLITHTEKTNVDALIGRKGIITKEIPANGKGYIKIGGEEWPAIAIDSKQIIKNKNAIVEKIDGNKMIVKAIEED
jgi:membrane protein implicated in regulation of membrane protease activity